MKSFLHSEGDRALVFASLPAHEPITFNSSPRDVRTLRTRPPWNASLWMGAILLLTAISVASGQSSSTRPRTFSPGTVNSISDLPAGQLRSAIEKLSAPAQKRAIDTLHAFYFPEADLASLRVDTTGGIFYADTFSPGPSAAPSEPEIGEGSSSLPVSPFPASLVFHSRPGATNIIFLNFAGETVVGTEWNAYVTRGTIPATPFSTDGDFDTFDGSEQAAIKRVWQRVAEDYAPFDVDVTTERPATFTTRTAHAIITRNTDLNDDENPAPFAGGVAYVTVYGTSTYATFSPAWVYYNNLANDEQYIAEAASHEVGHNLGLSHDGTTVGDEYYQGHGSGQISWGPIMGTGYDRNVSQWTKGDYYHANNIQDDLVIIAGKLSYRPDDHGNSLASATPLAVTGGTNVVSTTPETDPAGTNTLNKGVLELRGDIDAFSFISGGPVQLNVNPWVSPAGTRGGNLDVLVELRNSAGAVIMTANPTNVTGVQIQTNLSGLYYLYVRSISAGTPFATNPSGFTSYASVGQYFISGYFSELVTSNHSVPYSWLASFGFTNNQETLVNSNGANGRPIWQSYVAGLDPTNPSSQFRVSLQKTANNTNSVLLWNSVTGRVYTVEKSTNVFNGYNPVAGGVDLPATTTQFTNGTPANVSPVFYRIQVEKQ